MSHVTRSVNWLAAIIIGWAVLVAWLQPVDFFGDPDWASPVVVGTLTLVTLGAWQAFRRWTARWSPRTYRLVLWGVGLLIGIVQLLVAVSFVDASRADAYFVRSQAIILAHGSHHWLHYFMIYPNNVNFTLMEAALLKRTLAMVATPWAFLNGLRFLWLDTALISGLVILKRWRHWQPGALLLMLGWLVCVPIYAFGLFAYTDAAVMPMILDSLALEMLSRQGPRWRRWGLLSLNAVLIGCAVALKANLIVLWIATLLLILMQWRSHRIHWRGVLGRWALYSAGLLIVMGLMGLWRQASGYQPRVSERLPVTSWIAMTLNPRHNGQYVGRDFKRVDQQPTAAAKQRLATTMI